MSRGSRGRRRARRFGLPSLAVAVMLALPGSALAAATAPALEGSVSDPTVLAGATAVAVSGHYAYTTAYAAGRLTAIDISNPASPVIAGESTSTTAMTNASTVNISGGYAYVVSKNANGAQGSGSNDNGTGNAVTILDIATNPAQPAVVGSWSDPTKLFGAYGVAVSGRYAFVAAQGCVSGQPCPKTNVGNSFEVVDISLPAAPMIVQTIHNTTLLAHATSVAIQGTYAYVTAANSDRLTIIDISNPLSPQIVSSLPDTTRLNFPVDVAVQGNYAYVADQNSGPNELTVVDVSNPLSPVIVGTLNSKSLYGAYRIRVRGSLAYIAASSGDDVGVVDISNPAAPRLAGAYTDSARLWHTTGIDTDPSGRYAIATSPRLSTETQAPYPPYPLQPGGPTNTGTVSVIDMDPTPISVAIAAGSKPANPTVQTSADFAFAASDQVATFRCQLDGAGFGLCTTPTTQTYSGLVPGSHTFTVQATDSAGNTASASYSWTVNSPPSSSSAPTISGTTVSGQTLTATSGGWSGSPPPTFSYQWQDCDSSGASCTTITGATGSSYTLAPADVGFTVAVVVTASNSVGSASASSAATAVVTAPASVPVNSLVPVVGGSVVSGQTLTATTGGWSGSPAPSYGYQWQDCDGAGANCVAIAAATGPSYTLTGGDVGFTVEVVVTATNSAGSASASSAATAVVASVPVNSSVPVVSGSVVSGQTLTATTGGWSGSPAPSFAYQWQDCDGTGANCVAIAGATASSYTLAAADVGFTVEVVVTATNSAGSASASSAATAVVTAPSSAPANTSAPVVGGSVVEAQTLTATTGGWSGSPAPSFAYQWQDCDASGANCSGIAGATASSYTLVAADVGFTVEVVVTASNGSGSASASSAATAVVTSAPGPLTPLLDNFNRSGGSLGPNWLNVPAFSNPATNNLSISNQQVLGPSGESGDYWNTAYGANSEVWVTIVAKPTVNNDLVTLGLRYQNPGSATSSGYQAAFINQTAGTDEYRIWLRTNGTSSTTLASVTGPELVAGDTLLFRAIGPKLELWRKSGTTWTRILSATDGTITSGGYLVLIAKDAQVRLDNFGGGTLP